MHIDKAVQVFGAMHEPLSWILFYYCFERTKEFKGQRLACMVSKTKYSRTKFVFESSFSEVQLENSRKITHQFDRVVTVSFTYKFLFLFVQTIWGKIGIEPRASDTEMNAMNHVN